MENLHNQKVESVLLVWLLVREKGAHPDEGARLSEIAKALAKSLRTVPKEGRVTIQLALQRLEKSNLATLSPPEKPKRVPTWTLSDAGRTKALEALGISGFPKLQKVDWTWAKKNLVLRSLQQKHAAAFEHAGSSEWLAAWLLATHYRLPLTKELSPRSVLRDLAGRILNLSPSDGFSLEHAFSYLVFGDAPPFSLTGFARKVKEAAATAKSGRWLSDRIFINHVWKEAERKGEFGEMTFAQFQDHLIEAHQAKLLRLARGDLIAALPQDDARASETRDGGSEFHFVYLDEKASAGVQP